jgi:hypothetical protein
MDMKFIGRVGFFSRIQRHEWKRRDRRGQKSKRGTLTILQEFAAADTDGTAFLGTPDQ